MRYFFEISYKGTNYNGWQSQPNGIGVQAVVEDALTKLLRSPTSIVGSGRTDAGVHCKQQFFHTDISVSFHEDHLRQRLNSLLPQDIAIGKIIAVSPKASARYDAISRTYEYHIVREKSPFSQGFSWHFFKSVNVQTMNDAAALLIGTQDFECFSKVKTDVNHFLCEIKKAEWTNHGNDLVFTISANRFLRGMVRAVVGTLITVGTGEIGLPEFQAIVKSKDRRKAGANVPPQGLFLVEVNYPGEIFLTPQVEATLE